MPNSTQLNYTTLHYAATSSATTLHYASVMALHYMHLIQTESGKQSGPVITSYSTVKVVGHISRSVGLAETEQAREEKKRKIKEALG